MWLGVWRAEWSEVLRGVSFSAGGFGGLVADPPTWQGGRCAGVLRSRPRKALRAGGFWRVLGWVSRVEGDG